MKTRWIVWLVLSSLIVWGAPPTPTAAQPPIPPLPADLIITTRTEGTLYYTTLMRIDAQTLQISPFYVYEGSFLQPLRWSPDGDFLAVLRHPAINSDYMELCLLSREGVLKSCLENRIVSHAFGLRSQDYMITWSEDSRYVYFVTDYEQYHRVDDVIESWEASLVKAEVATGQTQEILYQPPIMAHEQPPELYWTDDLHYLWPYRWDLTTIHDLWQNTDIPLPQNTPTLGDLEYCPLFSPQESYLTARTYQNKTFSGFALVSLEGQVVQTVGSDRLLPAGIADMECPTWQSDEAAFYFLGSTQDEAILFKYVVADDTLIAIKQLWPRDPQDPAYPQAYPLMPFRLAPDNATLAISFYPGEAILHAVTSCGFSKVWKCRESSVSKAAW